MPPTPPNSPFAPGNMPVTPVSTPMVPFDYGMWTPWQYSPMPTPSPMLAGPSLPPPAAPPAAPPPVAAPVAPPAGGVDPVSGQPTFAAGPAPAGPRMYAADPARSDIYVNLAHMGNAYGLDALRAAGNWGRKAFGDDSDKTFTAPAPGPDSGPRPLPVPPYQTHVWDDPYAQQQAQAHMQTLYPGTAYNPGTQQPPAQHGGMHPMQQSPRGPQVGGNLQSMIRRIRGY